MNDIGHNQPPSQIEFSQETVNALSAWMKDNPVIQDADVAREAKSMCDRAAACLKDMDDERRVKVDPLNERVKTINATYKGPYDTLTRVLTELTARINAFILREEEKRRKEAAEAQAKMEEAERLAREAEEVERKAIEEAKGGVCDADVGVLVREADEKFSRFKEARNALKRAQHAQKVKVGGGFRRAASLRNKEELIVDDWQEAIKCMGLTDAIRNAILTEARAFRKTLGELPNGVIAQKTRG